MRLLLLLGGLLVSCLAAAADPVVITPDDPSSVQRGILAAYQSGATKVVIPPGIYHLPRPEVGCHLEFSDLKNFTIDATGVTFIPEGRDRRSFLIRNCENVTFQGATFVREVPPFSQGKIEVLAPDRSSADVRIDRGYPTDLDDAHYFPNTRTMTLFTPGTQKVKPLVPNLYLAGIERLGPDLFRFHFRAPLAPEIAIAVGDAAAWRGSSGGDICCWESARMVFKDITLKNATGLSFFEIAGDGDNHYEHCVITYAPPPPGATDLPLLASGTDGFHSAAVRHGPTLENCSFEGLDDDQVNIHGTYAMVMEAHDGTAVVDWRSPHSGARVPLPPAQPGDPVRFYDRTGVWVADAHVLSVTPKANYVPGDLGQVDSRTFSHRDQAVYFELKLDRPVTDQPGGFMANPNQEGSGFIIRNCTFRNSCNHGLFIRASDGLIEGCTIEGIEMGGIVVAPEVGSWNEADFSHHLVIRNNVIRDVALGTQPWNSGITVAGFEKSQYVPLPGGHRDIVIDGNRLENNRGPNLIITSVIGVKIENNRFIHPMTEPAFHIEKIGFDNPGALVWMRQAAGVSLHNNTVTAPGSYLHTLLDTDGTVTGTGIPDGLQSSP